MSASTATFNEIVSRSWTTSEITSSTISQVWTFFEEFFSGFEDVTFSRNVSSSVLTINLDSQNKMKIIVSLNGTSGILAEYYIGNNKCVLSDSASTASTEISYLRTEYGVAWGINISKTDFAFPNYYIPQSVHSMFIGVSTNNTNTYYILSENHTNIEAVSEYSTVIADGLGGRKFLLTNPYSFEANLRIKHFYRVLGVPQNSFARGEVRINGKNYFWCGYRFMLEFEEIEE
jgi:hypothetical protein